MSTALLIMRRELGAYFRSMTGYIIAAAVLLADGILFQVMVLSQPDVRSAAVLRDFFFYASGPMMIASVFISMRLIAEERQTGTLALLSSSPVRDFEIVLGKFLSAFIFLSVTTLATGFIPLLVLLAGKISFGHLCAGYLGLLLLGATTTAIGTFGSALARSQVIAAITSAILVVSMLLAWMLARVTERPLNDVFAAVALFHRHFTPFMSGVVHLRDVVYYVVTVYFFLFLSTRVLEARRWR